MWGAITSNVGQRAPAKDGNGGQNKEDGGQNKEDGRVGAVGMIGAVAVLTPVVTGLLQFSTAWLDSQVKQQQNLLQQMSSSNRARAGQGLSDGRGTFKRMLAKTHTEVVPATNSVATASSADTRGDGADWRGWQDWLGAWSTIFRKTATGRYRETERQEP